MAVVCLLVEYNKRILLTLKNSLSMNMWYIPKGRILYGENLIDAVKRILLLETGMHSDEIVEQGSKSIFWLNNHEVSYIFHVKVTEDKAIMSSQNRSHKWIDHIPENAHLNLKSILDFVEYFK